MDEQMALNLVIGIMQKRKVIFQIHPSGNEVRVPQGTSATYLRAERGNPSGRIFITFRSPLVNDIKLTARSEAKFFRWINAKNGGNRLCRLVAADPPMPAPAKSASRTMNLEMEYELLAEALHEDVVMHVLQWFWMLADRFDDEAVKEFGGKRHVEPREPKDRKPVSETVEI